MRQALTTLAVAVLIASTGLAIRAMEQDVTAPSTVTVTVQTDDGASFKLNGRVILSDSATPDTVIVEIWKNGTKTTHWFIPVVDAVADSLLGRMPRFRSLAK